jgi:CheY-like chemotaxis protein
MTGPKEPVERVLVVDDSADSALIMKKLLSLKGHTVHTVVDGPAALECLDEFRPHAIVLDLNLPGLSGHEVAEAVRRHPTFRSVLMIAVTGRDRDEDRLRSRQAGIDHHLVKPVDISHLARLLVGE